ncbi:MAG: rhodanese-like domain-containing protein [Oscillospiraceae bacterium]|nr:rhodanese-like domain-containing protein [Oscillospiraceae bacterium]
MKLFDIFGTLNIDKNLEEYNETCGAVLLDVRTNEEYAEGHIPKSKNLPLQVIDKAGKFIDNKDVPIFVYCKSGSRSSMAQEALKSMGYRNVKNLGGISAYTGKVEY